MKDCIYKLVCGLLGVLLNVATIGTYGNIMTFLTWDDDDREKYEPVYRSLGISENCFKWISAIVNTLLIGIPQGIIGTTILVKRFIATYRLLRTLKRIDKILELSKDVNEKEAEA